MVYSSAGRLIHIVIRGDREDHVVHQRIFHTVSDAFLLSLYSISTASCIHADFASLHHAHVTCYVSYSKPQIFEEAVRKT
jgi:hypothetical protein